MFNTKKKYGVILADPPFSFRCYSKKGEGRAPQAHYDCMSIEELKCLPVSHLAAENCALFLWVPVPFLQRGFELIDAWGFTYSTVGYFWAKIKKTVDPACLSVADFPMGTGYWTRANVEICLLAKKGRPTRLAKDVRELIIAPRREHSRKPDEVYDRIERLVDGPYIELFARQRWPGWDAWGNEVGRFDEEGIDNSGASLADPSGFGSSNKISLNRTFPD